MIDNIMITLYLVMGAYSTFKVWLDAEQQDMGVLYMLWIFVCGLLWPICVLMYIIYSLLKNRKD